jgi:hypothetical protein
MNNIVGSYREFRDKSRMSNTATLCFIRCFLQNTQFYERPYSCSEHFLESSHATFSNAISKLHPRNDSSTDGPSSAETVKLALCEIQGHCRWRSSIARMYRVAAAARAASVSGLFGHCTLSFQKKSNSNITFPFERS